ncbi:hypothetical protein [Methylophaga lonarensis]|uniref:hypothetical protein n=1 Tax=Methylophaga lonarensis TaxID=999151 RepID=UPI003D2E4AEC
MGDDDFSGVRRCVLVTSIYALFGLVALVLMLFQFLVALALFVRWFVLLPVRVAGFAGRWLLGDRGGW